MLDLYSKGMGSAAIEAEKSSQNLSGRLNALSNSWNDTFNNIVNSNMVLFVVNSLNELLTVLNKITEATGTLGTVAAGAGIFGMFKSVGCLKMPVCPLHI